MTAARLAVIAQAAAHYQRALQIDAANSAARSEAALVEHARRNIEAGNAVLDTDARQALWYADVASRQVTPVLEPAAMLRCKVTTSSASPLCRTCARAVMGDQAHYCLGAGVYSSEQNASQT